MEEYILKESDFDQAFRFAIKYHLDPKKSSSGRTTGSARGLGEVIDSFVRGKLVEIGVSNILSAINPSKEYLLDFDIKPQKEIQEEPDIVKIKEGKGERDPKLFVEIKNISEGDRWVGITKEQFLTSKIHAKGRKIFIVGAYIKNRQQGLNGKQTDLLGIYLKNKFKADDFKDFGNLAGNISVVVSYAISGDDLEKNGQEFKEGGYFYETEAFSLAGANDSKMVLAEKFKKVEDIKSGKIDLYKANAKIPKPDFLGDVSLKSGSVSIFEKKNAKSLKRFVVCKSDSKIENKVLGLFELKNGNVYFFNLGTVGRNPRLKRNNIWIAKRSIPYLSDKKIIPSNSESLSLIAKGI